MSLRSWKDKKVPEESHAGEYKLQQTEMQWNAVKYSDHDWICLIIVGMLLR